MSNQPVWPGKYGEIKKKKRNRPDRWPGQKKELAQFRAFLTWSKMVSISPVPSMTVSLPAFL